MEAREPKIGMQLHQRRWQNHSMEAGKAEQSPHQAEKTLPRHGASRTNREIKYLITQFVNQFKKRYE